jgi:TolB protein
MRIVTTIIIILLVVAVIFLGSLILKYTLFKPSAPEETALPETEESIAEEEVQPPTETEETPVEVEEDKISVIEIYLDGDRKDGTLLGEAVYGMTSQDAYDIYGEEFSETGFLLAGENKEYDFEPGSTHYLYTYVLIPKYGWSYARQKTTLSGEPGYDENIKISIDDPPETVKEADKTNIKISGWSVDTGQQNSPGVDRVEIYLNGPKGFGKSLGEVNYGIERQDIANTFGNANYLNSGYSLYFDGGSLEAGSDNTLYIYSFSISGSYNLGLRDLAIEGEAGEPKAIISAEASLKDEYIEISGWAINRDDITGGKPKNPDTEYSIKKIIFTSNKTGNEDIFSMNIDGTGLTQLTDYPGKDNYPSVSPDGEKIAYTSDINGVWQIMVMNWDGTEKKQLTYNPWRSGYPAWSFDGRYIFFEASIDGDYELYRINSNGGGLKRLTSNPNIPDWHPYGHPFRYKVIYESGMSKNEELYIMDYDGKNINKISDADMRQRTPAISVDGEIIIFSDNESLYTMDFNGDNIQKISGDLSRCRHPDMSPDNKYIAFESMVDGQEEIFIVSSDDGNFTRLTNIPGNDYDPVFLFRNP